MLSLKGELMNSKLMHRVLFSLMIAAGTLWVSACSKPSLSERDTRLEQIRNNGEKKRTELELVAHDYEGALKASGVHLQDVVMHLEIKDVPYQEGGEVDPVMVPELTGYLRYVFGGSQSNSEYINFSLQKADYDAKVKSLNLIFTNAQYKTLSIEVVQDGDVLKGTWIAQALGDSGTIELVREDNVTDKPAGVALAGTYEGRLTNTHPDTNFASQASITLVVTQDLSQPSGQRVTGKLRLYFSESEWDEFPFDSVDYNPITRVITAKSGSADSELQLTLRLNIEQKILKGVLYEDALGQVATLEVAKP